MLKAIWERWRTPKVPRSELIDLRYRYVELMAENERLESSVRELDDDNNDLRLQRKQLRTLLRSARVERCEAIGKLESVESQCKELEKKLAADVAYIRWLETGGEDECHECGMIESKCECE